MKKKSSEATEAQHPSYIDELLKNGSIILSAKSMEELAEMVNMIPADVKYGAGAAGKNPETGEFTLRLDIV